jgi:hypothetical protein
MRGSSWIAAQLVASQEGLSSMKLVKLNLWFSKCYYNSLLDTTRFSGVMPAVFHCPVMQFIAITKSLYFLTEISTRANYWKWILLSIHKWQEWYFDCVEAGPNTSTVTLRVIEGDKTASLESETVKYGCGSQGTRIREWLHWRGPAAVVNDSVPNQQTRNWQ